MSYFDALTLAAVVDQLQSTLLGGRIQHVVLPSQLSVALEIYAAHQRHHLLLSAHPRFARLHLSATKLSRGLDTPTPMLLLLRKYVNGGYITDIQQPELERVAIISIAKGPQPRNMLDIHDWDQASPAASLPNHVQIDDEPGLSSSSMAEEDDEPEEILRCELIIEIMEQRSNIVLVGDDNIILGSVRRVTHQMSRRPILPHEPYELPPAQNKHDPRQVSAASMQALLHDPATSSLTLARALVTALRGLSPLAAREIAFRSTGNAAQKLDASLPWERIAAAVQEIWSAGWQPSSVMLNGEPEYYAPYMLTSIAEAQAGASISDVLDRYYAAREHLTKHQQRRDALIARLNEQRERLERQQAALSGQLEQARGLERLRWEGEMIYAYIHTIQPYQKEVILEDETGAQRTISLNPERSAVENAQERFRAYEKAKSAIEGVPERLREVELRIQGLDELSTMVSLADGFEALESLSDEAIELGYLPAASGRRKRSRAAGMPLRMQSSDGLTIYVGRSASQNEMTTFKLGAPTDLWLHTRSIPGAHVIIKSSAQEIPQRSLEEAAGLAAYFSKARNERLVEVDYARRSQVRRIKDGPPGLVSYQAEGTLRVAPRAPW